MRVVIIGGGAVGLSLAWHLTRRGSLDITLVERNQLTSGTSWHAAGIVGPLRASPGMTRLAMAALDVFPELERLSGLETGYRRTGGYWLARKTERLDELHRIAAVGQHVGIDARVVAPDEVGVSGLDLSAHVGALRVVEDASVNPVDLCMAYARLARDAGVDIREQTPVADLLVESGQLCGVQLADGTRIEADRVALCAGAWSRSLASRAGVALPLQAVEHMYIVTEPIEGLDTPYPVLRDLDRGIYVKGDAGRLVIGGFEPDAKCWDTTGVDGAVPFLELPEDWEQFEPFMQAALDLLPALEHTGVQHFMNGPESFTVDSKPLVGEAPEVDGLYVAAGMNSVGVMSSAGIGRALADWMCDGYPPVDLWEIDISRADPASADNEHLAERMTEAVADVFALHWPYKQPRAGRGLRQSALHQRWSDAGAVFGLTAGWERGLWYARDASERDVAYSVGRQDWESIAAREASEMANGVALVDLSPFSKFDVVGSDVATALGTLSTATLDVEIGKAVYTPLCNVRGGIEADVTVTRLSQDAWRITSGAATRWRDLAWLRRMLPPTVKLTDRTEEECVIGVMGPDAPALMQRVSSSDWLAFPFSTSRESMIGDIRCRATRISFVGETGWELNVATPDAPALFDLLAAEGPTYLGHYALDGCRVEKGFRHWGHDIGPDVTPLEAGLGFAIDWDHDFAAKGALMRQRQTGVSRRLVLFQLPREPLMLHDEPIWLDDTVVGFTTSGAMGPRTGLNLAFGLIDVEPGESIADMMQREYRIEVAGRLYPATMLRRPPYDPDGIRMRT